MRIEFIIKAFNYWWNLSMKMKILTGVLFIAICSFMTFGCLATQNTFIKKVDTLYSSIEKDYIHYLETPDPWGGIGPEEKKEIVETKMLIIKELRFLIEEEKKSKGVKTEVESKKVE